MLRLTPVVKQLLIINVIVYIASMLLHNIDLALYFPGSPNFQPYQLITHFFMHGSIGHIFFNMFALVMFGSTLEARWGPKRFLFFYFFCAIGAAILYLGYDFYTYSQMENAIAAFKTNPTLEPFNAFFDQVNMSILTPEFKEWIDAVRDRLFEGGHPEMVGQVTAEMNRLIQDLQTNNAAVGASGAIYGLLMAFGLIFPNVELMLIFLPIPIKAKYFIPVLMLVELFLGMNNFSWDNIAHFAHIGGALFGLLLILYWRKFDSNYPMR